MTATALGPSEVRVAWKDASHNETGFRLYDGASYVTVPANTASYTWGGFAPGTWKCFVVVSYNNVGSSPWSNQLCTFTASVPAAPTSVTATPLGPGEVWVAWSDAANNETGFRLYDGASYVTVPANTTSYTWGGFAPGTWKCFVVGSYNNVGSSQWSNQACLSTPTIPASPTGVTATALSSSEIRVTWTDVSNDETAFRLYDGVSYVTVPANTTSYTWGGFAPGTWKCFVVGSYNSAGSSPWSDQACTSTPTLPSPPTGLSVTPVSSSEIRVAWTDASANEDGFRVSDGVGTVTVGANTTSFTWGGLLPGTSKCFRVQSYNIAGSSPSTPGACATTTGGLKGES